MNTIERTTPPSLAVLSLATLVIYLLTGSECHTWDAIAYTARIYDAPLLSERYLSTTLFHPHHLLFISLGKAFLFFRNLLPTGSQNPFVSLQVMNAVFGSGAVYLLGKTIFARTRDTGFSVMFAGLFALSFAMWRFSTEVEVMVPSIFFGLWAVYSTQRGGSPVLTALLVSVAVLIHQINLFVAVAIVVFLVTNQRGKKTDALTFAAVSIFFVAGVYIGVSLAKGFQTPAQFFDWVFAARSRSSLEVAAPHAAVWVGLKSLFHAVGVPFARHGVSDYPIVGVVGGWIVAIVTGVAAIYTMLSVRTLIKTDRFTLLTLTWFGGVALFATVFQPWNIEYWIYAIPPMSLLFADALATRTQLRGIAVTSGFGFALVLGLVSFLSIVPLTDPDNADYARPVREFGMALNPGDVVLSGPVEKTELGPTAVVAIPFFTGIDVQVLGEGETDPGSRIEQLLTEGHDVYLIEETLTPDLRSRLAPFSLETVQGLGNWKVRRVTSRPSEE